MGKKNKVDHNEIPSPIMLSGTSVLTGEGKMIIIAVGDFSCLGKIRSVLVQDEDGPTPLQNKLEKIA
jgi:magnesium-transporting ATPase (P-type)